MKRDFELKKWELVLMVFGAVLAGASAWLYFSDFSPAGYTRLRRG